MSIPGFTADTVTYRGSGAYRSGHGAPARVRPGVLPQALTVQQAGGIHHSDEWCARICANRCRAVCKNPLSENCDACFSPCMDTCTGTGDRLGLF
ncbi:hypothetical protein [Kitasatospora griseola]|uniref:hypothetical protein n=1 Tax=Kitasatospora griseola TaxID=2064 RepID=UPI00381A1533